MDNPARADRPLLESISVVLLVLEVLMLAGVGAVYVAYAVLGGEDDAARAAMLAAFALLIAAAMAAAAWGMWHGRRWSYGAALTWQVLQASVGAAIVEVRPEVGVALVLAAAVVIVAVVRAMLRRGSATGGDSPEPPATGDRGT